MHILMKVECLDQLCIHTLGCRTQEDLGWSSGKGLNPSAVVRNSPCYHYHHLLCGDCCSSCGVDIFWPLLLSSGVVNMSFPLSDQPVFGEWFIFVEMQGHTYNKSFEVQKYGELITERDHLSRLGCGLG